MNHRRDRQCAGKARHTSHARAQIALAKTIEQTGEVGLVAYECRYCAGFHVGHAPKKDQRQMKYDHLLKTIDLANGRGAVA
jgi:hypothetical protein